MKNICQASSNQTEHQLHDNQKAMDNKINGKIIGNLCVCAQVNLMIKINKYISIRRPNRLGKHMIRKVF